MPIIEILFVLILVGVALYIVQLLPMDDTIRKIIRVIVLLLVLVWVLSLFGLLPAWHGGYYYRR